MLEWLKTILGDAYTPETDAAVDKELQKGYAPLADLAAKEARIKELESQAGQLEGQVKGCQR